MVYLPICKAHGVATGLHFQALQPSSAAPTLSAILSSVSVVPGRRGPKGLAAPRGLDHQQEKNNLKPQTSPITTCSTLGPGLIFASMQATHFGAYSPTPALLGASPDNSAVLPSLEYSETAEPLGASTPTKPRPTHSRTELLLTVSPLFCKPKRHLIS